MPHLVEIILLALVLWIGISFYWCRIALAIILMFALALCLAALTWLTLHGLLSTPWDWYYLLILPAVGLGLYMLWAAYWVVLERGKTWLSNQIHHHAWHKHS